MKDSKNSSYRENPSGIAWVDTSFLVTDPQWKGPFCRLQRGYGSRLTGSLSGCVIRRTRPFLPVFDAGSIGIDSPIEELVSEGFLSKLPAKK
jgi:hypothetical protein